MMARLVWTDDGDAFLRQFYRDRGARWCAGLVGCRKTAVYARVKRLGLMVSTTWLTDEQIRMVLVELHAIGWTDAEIKRELERRHGVNVDRHRINALRRAQGLAHNANRSEHSRNRVRFKTREQLDTAGLASLAELRSQELNKFKRSLGWPESLTLRAAQAMEIMYRRGAPVTRVELCQLMGIKDRSRTAPKSNAPGGTVLAELQRAELIGVIRKAISVPASLQIHDDKVATKTRNNKTKNLNLYFVLPGVRPDDH